MLEVHVYDATHHLEADPEESLHSLNLVALEDCPLWQKEIPIGSFIAVNFLPNLFNLQNGKCIGFNLLSATLLVLPS